MSHLIKPQTNFTTIPNHIINDDRLSLKAKGLFLYLCSKPDGWNFSADRIKSETKDGEDSILSALKELENFGLLKRVQKRVKGVFKGNDYALFYDFSPKRENPVTDKPKREKPSPENPSPENPVSNKEIENKEILDEREIFTYEFQKNLDRVRSDFPMIDSFLDELCKSKTIKSPLSYRTSILEALFIPNNKRHTKTLLAYNDFCTRYKPNGSLPFGVNIFDLIGRE